MTQARDEVGRFGTTPLGQGLHPSDVEPPGAMLVPYGSQLHGRQFEDGSRSGHVSAKVVRDSLSCGRVGYSRRVRLVTGGQLIEVGGFGDRAPGQATFTGQPAGCSRYTAVTLNKPLDFERGQKFF